MKWYFEHYAFFAATPKEFGEIRGFLLDGTQTHFLVPGDKTIDRYLTRGDHAFEMKISPRHGQRGWYNLSILSTNQDTVQKEVKRAQGAVELHKSSKDSKKVAEKIAEARGRK